MCNKITLLKNDGIYNYNQCLFDEILRAEKFVILNEISLSEKLISLIENKILKNSVHFYISTYYINFKLNILQEKYPYFLHFNILKLKNVEIKSPFKKNVAILNRSITFNYINVMFNYCLIDDRLAIFSNSTSDVYNYKKNTSYISPIIKHRLLGFKLRIDGVVSIFNSLWKKKHVYDKEFESKSGLYNKHQYDLIITMLNNAKNYIYIESKYFWSDDTTSNNISRILANKIKNKHSRNEPFKLVIYTNRRNHQLSFKEQLITTLKTSNSLHYLFQETKLSIKDFERYVSINYINSKSHRLLIENFIISVDGNNLFCSTGYIDDSYLISKNIEFSLGVRVSNQHDIKQIEQELFKTLIDDFNKGGEIISIDDVFSANYETPNIHKYNFISDYQLIELINEQSKFKNNFLLKFLLKLNI